MIISSVFIVIHSCPYVYSFMTVNPCMAFPLRNNFMRKFILLNQDKKCPTSKFNRQLCQNYYPTSQAKIAPTN